MTAAENGHAEELLELLDVGANIDFKQQVCANAENIGLIQQKRAFSYPRCLLTLLLVALLCLIALFVWQLEGLLRQDGYTALISAAAEGRTDCVRLLAERGADKEVVCVRYMKFVAFRLRKLISSLFVFS